MIGLEFDDTIILEQQKVLEAALSTNPKTQKALQKLIRKVIMEARAKVSSAASDKMKNDPRGAAQAVRTSVYKKILGANINIYNSRKAHGMNNYEPPVKGSIGRGGNRRFRSAKTMRMMSYAPLDRGMILRWINNGTKNRSINFTENKNRTTDKWNKHPNTGNRGSIAARNWFRSVTEPKMQTAILHLSELINTELENILNKK